MFDSKIQMTRRALLGAGLFAGASWALKSCGNTPQTSSTSEGTPGASQFGRKLENQLI